MESPKYNLEPDQKSAAANVLQGGEVVVPGTAADSPQEGAPPRNDDEKINGVAEVIDNKDGNVNPANRPRTDAAPAPKNEPAKN